MEDVREKRKRAEFFSSVHEAWENRAKDRCLPSGKRSEPPNGSGDL